MKDDRISLADLRERFNAHTTWHCYRNKKTNKVFAIPKDKVFKNEDIDKVGTANNCCHKTAIKIAKGKP